MDRWLTDLASVAWAQTWQLTVLFAVVWIIVRAVARNRPHLASVLWLLVLVKCVTPPVWSSPAGIFCWLQRSIAAHPVVEIVTTTPVNRRAHAAIPASSPVAKIEADEVRDVLAARASAPTPLPHAAPPSASQSHVDLQARLLLGGVIAWLTGCTIFAAMTIVRLQSCWRQMCHAQRIVNPELEALLQQLRQQLGVRRPVRLWITASRVGPAVIGFWRPIVIVPAALVQGKSPAELAPLLAHELVHIRRGDLWLGLLQTLAESVWWFHPLVRVASRLFTREAERCCDEAVIAQLQCTPAAYARGLLDVLALKQQLQPVPSFPGVRPVDVTRGRLERIMQLRQGCRKRTPWWCWLVLMLAAAAALPGAALIVGAGEDDAGKSGQPPPADLISWNRVTLQAVNAEAAAAASGNLVVRTYDLADLVEQFCTEYDLPRPSARTSIEWHIERSAPGPWKPKGSHDANPRTNSRFEHGWVNDKLIVVHTAAGHEQIESQLKILRGPYGLAQLTMEIRIISGPVIALDQIAANWKLIGATADSETGTSRLDDKAIGNTPVSSGNVSNIRGTVRTVIERQVPAVLALLADDEVRSVLGASQSDQHANVLQAPKVTVFNGQSVRFNDTTQGPFVVGIKPTPDGGEEPQIRVVSEGSTITIRPELQTEDKVLLDLGLTLSHIRSVETAEFPTGRSDAPRRVQVPEVGTTRIQSTVEMVLDQTLAIGLPAVAASKAFKPGCILVTVRRVPQSEINAAERSQAHYRRVEADSAAAKSVAAEPTPPESVAANRVSDVVERVYHVADLVVGFPLEPLVISLAGQPVKSSPPKVVGPDYESLLEMVTQTIAPQSWAAKGGTGTIEALPNRLSVIVRQTSDVHEQVADLFTQLRRLQDVQILWTAELLKLKLVKEISEGPLAEVTRGEQRRVVLHPAEAQSLRGLRESNDTWASPKITLFNGQSLDLRLQPGSKDAPNRVSRLQLQSTVAADFRFVRVLAATNEETLGAGGPLDIPRGHSLLIDVSARDAEDAASPHERQWCLLTPKVLLMSREPYARVLSAQDSERTE